jgi:hypothetical protein
MSSDTNGGRSPADVELRDSRNDWAEPGDMLEDPDLELITDYLTNQLPPERLAEVKWRLEHDEAFRELAAPLVLAWTVPPLWQRDPVPSRQVAKYWNDFTKRTGILERQQPKAAKPRRRRRWLRWVVLLLLAPIVIPVLAFGVLIVVAVFSGLRNARQVADVRWTEHVASAVTKDGWMPIANGWVKLDSGAKVLTATVAQGPRVNMVKLEGSARFRRAPGGDVASTSDTTFLTVMTSAGFVSSPGGEFRVTTRVDTTEVEVLARPGTTSPTRDLVALSNAPGGAPGIVLLTSGEVGRLEPGHPPVKVRGIVGDPAGNDRAVKRVVEELTPWIIGISAPPSRTDSRKQ